MAQTDSLGRATFHYIPPANGVRPTDREIRWFKHIERHGPQSSVYLFEVTRDTHRCKDTALRALQRLRAGGFLTLPRQQRATARAEFEPYIYDLTTRARDFLAARGLSEPAIRPTGHWWHAYATACVTSSIDIMAARAGVRYIPCHVILARKGAGLGIPTSKGSVIPDQLFALDYGGSFRAFALEVDRGTEPLRSSSARKSIQKSLAQYSQILEDQVYKTQYGLKANLLVLWVFHSSRRQRQFLDLAARMPPVAARSTLCISQALETRCFEQMIGAAGIFCRHWINPHGCSTDISSKTTS
ncbi:replication-relaxation family protein [Aestuariicoccus sp. MJ-SS9]|uniref:replication-relaxation family protein n=1 Tax=Aestuariicoccus sp. MJ-SS9 TaxID=3079855 RepID=UPI00290B67E8|nr:replication-relaxation family protein [Aestuariicoccus sp. MJ-SS9]MDU8913928.1 replication-relaxation family protein [Aestuariicoccus sp. MJ-SS9]